MEEGEEVILQVPTPQRIDPGSFLLGAAGESLTLFGGFFILWGVASFVSAFLAISGSGEFLVGIFLALFGKLLVSRSKAALAKMPQPQPQQIKIPVSPPPKPPEQNLYR